MHFLQLRVGNTAAVFDPLANPVCCVTGPAEEVDGLDEVLLDCDADGQYAVITKLSNKPWGITEFKADLSQGKTLDFFLANTERYYSSCLLISFKEQGGVGVYLFWWQ